MKRQNQSADTECSFAVFQNDGEPEVIAKTHDHQSTWFKIDKNRFLTTDQTMKVYGFMEQNNIKYADVNYSGSSRKHILDDKEFVVTVDDKEVNLADLPAYDNPQLRQKLEKFLGKSEKFAIKQDKKDEQEQAKMVRSEERNAKLRRILDKVRNKLTFLHNHGKYVYDDVDIKNVEAVKTKFGHSPFEQFGFRDDFKSGYNWVGWKEFRPVYVLNMQNEVVMLGASVYKVEKARDEYENHPARYSFSNFISKEQYAERLKISNERKEQQGSMKGKSADVGRPEQ